MPIYLNRDLSSHNTPAGGKWPCRNSAGDSAANCIDIGLINNMPDGALKATEHQFIRLLDSVADGVAVRLMFYTLPEVPRSALGRRHVNSFYSSIDSLLSRRLDGLIVTGTEPRTSNLRDEPYWANMARVMEWAEHNTHSAVWSCLAAHAAVLHNDGITRRRLSQKRCGLFQFTRVSDHPLIAGISSLGAMPHSRWNDLAEDELTACGYRILTRAEHAGVDAFVKQGKSLFVFFQGHPEYEAKTLLHEYGRDLRRYLRRESDTYPDIPHGYFDREAEDALMALRARAECDRREELLADFPTALAERNLADPWRSAAIRIYGNWLTYLCARKGYLLKKGPGRRGSTRERESLVLQRAAGAD
jgi:homoserine O-succinyltransferase